MKGKTFLWAVDIHADEGDQSRTLKQVHSVAEQTGCKVQPIFVLSPRTLNVSLSRLVDIDVEHYRESVVEQLEDWNKKYTGGAVQPALMLVVPIDSLKHCVEAVGDYAKDHKAPFVVSSTNNPNALKRFFIGSFTESLLAYSGVPVLCLNPHSDKNLKLEKLFMPSLFEDKSKRVFDLSVELAQATGAKLELFNVLPSFDAYPTEAMVFHPSVYHNFSDSIKAETQRIQDAGEMWLSTAEEKNIDCTLTLSDEVMDASDVILREAKSKDSDLIVMDSKVSPMESAFLGSVARRVLREAECPVLVVHQ